MSYTYPPVYLPVQPSALSRALNLWLLSNLGGTCWLVLDFGFSSSAELVTLLVIGLMAALISLFFVPLLCLFLSLAHRTGTPWRCRTVAVLGVTLVFGLVNFVLLRLLPIGSLDSLLSVSRPYLGAAMVALVWLYAPQAARHKRPAAALLLGLWWRPSSQTTRAGRLQAAWH